MADAKKDDPGVNFNDVSDFMQKMWNPFGIPIPGFGMPGVSAGVPGAPVPGIPAAMPFPNPAMMFATLNPADIARKIDELRVIEGWLQMSLNMMQLSIKTMELQKASLEALRTSNSGGHEDSSSGGRKP